MQVMEASPMQDWEVQRAARRKEWEEWAQSFRDRFPTGYIVAQSEQNGYHDSYFSELLFIASEQRLEWVSTGTTAGGCASYSSELPKIEQAPLEVQQLFIQTVIARQKQALERHALASAIAFTQSIQHESKVIVAKNFKQKGEAFTKGSEAIVFWMGEDSYQRVPRYGIRFHDDRKAFVNYDKLILVHSWKVSDEKIAAYLEERFAVLDAINLQDAVYAAQASNIVSASLHLGRELVDAI